MKRGIRSMMAALAVGLMSTHFSCATTVGSALRDAAIDGAAGFVEGATAELLDLWFGDDLAP